MSSTIITAEQRRILREFVDAVRKRLLADSVKPQFRTIKSAQDVIEP